MGECNLHYLACGPAREGPTAENVHILGDKPADVLDIACPECGTRLFIYYRTVPGEGPTPKTTEDKGT